MVLSKLLPHKFSTNESANQQSSILDTTPLCLRAFTLLPTFLYTYPFFSFPELQTRSSPHQVPTQCSLARSWHISKYCTQLCSHIPYIIPPQVQAPQVWIINQSWCSILRDITGNNNQTSWKEIGATILITCLKGFIPWSGIFGPVSSCPWGRNSLWE